MPRPLASLAELPLLEQATLAPQSLLLVRTDLNIPLSPDRTPASFARIDAVLPLIKQTQQHTLLLCSHFGRPQQQNRDKLSLRPLVSFLEQRWQQKVAFLGDCQNPKSRTPKILASLRESNAIGLFENLRFHPGEEKNDPTFAANLVAQGDEKDEAKVDLYVNDAFSVCHRAHASTSAVTTLLPSYAGPSLKRELETLLPRLALERHQEEQKSIALLGGAKVSTKIDLLRSLMRRCSAVCLGGAMANCFLAARGMFSAAAFEEQELRTARMLEKQFQEQEETCRLLLPVDGACIDEAEDSSRIEVPLEGCTVPIGDLGTESCRAIERLLDKAAHGTWVVVNGPLGIVERPAFEVATLRLLRFLAEKTERGLLRTIVGGGDTLAALERAERESGGASQGVAGKFTHLSLGGGAFLELLSGENLPALEALRQSKERQKR